MVELNTTGDTVWMLVVTFGVGLVGGLAAAFIEWRKNCAQPSAKACNRFWGAVSCVFLGAVAAVAILYFFPPTTTETSSAGETVTSYDLVKLVALSLIVGSAGASFLQTMQTRALALASAERTEATKATATEALEGLPAQAEKAAESGIEAAASQIQDKLRSKKELKPREAEKAIEELATEASKTVADLLGSQVDTAQKMVAAAATGESS
ncbi:MAG TPA: hypothetical protein VMT37_10445 [Solirubrobacterales bacterium]|nr:hypothetical protein [Solirubrobacterales bacterium]